MRILNDTRTSTKSRSWTANIAASLLAAVLLQAGCAVDQVSFVSYTSRAEVKPSESPRSPVVGSSPFPWDIVLKGAGDILTGARRKAIEERVGYRESRSFVLFHLKNATSPGEARTEPCAPPSSDAEESE
jgi:hypothetical protein